MGDNLKDHGITSEESEQYDRQIRVWGLQAQQRLKQTSVLVIGFRGLGSEILKSLALAGVSTLYVNDDEPAEMEDLSSNLFITARDVEAKRRRADVAKEGIRELNERCELVVVEGKEGWREVIGAKKVEMCCLTGASIHTTMDVGTLCRRHGVKFMAGSLLGTFQGWVLADLLEHEYHEGDKASEVQRIGYPSTESLVRDFIKGRGIPNRLRRRGDDLVFAIRAMWSHQVTLGKSSLTQDDVIPLGKEVERFAEWFGVRRGYLSNATISELIATSSSADQGKEPRSEPELCAVTTLVGGLFSQEVLKAVGRKGFPLCNLLVVDAMKGEAHVYHVTGEQAYMACRTAVGDEATATAAAQEGVVSL